MPNPLVAHEEHSTDLYAGISVLDSTRACVGAIASGDWIEAGISATGVALDEISLYEDLAAALASFGAGWLIEHVHALSEPLDWLAGKPEVIAAHARTWGNIADAVGTVRGDYARAVTSELTGWQGAAADAYRSSALRTGHLLEALAIAANGIQVAITLSGNVVADVRGKIQKIVAAVVGALISWVAELMCTGGLAAPLVAEQALGFIATWAVKIAELVTKLVKTIKTLMPLLRHLNEVFDTIKNAMDAQQRGHSVP